MQTIFIEFAHQRDGGSLLLAANGPDVALSIDGRWSDTRIRVRVRHKVAALRDLPDSPYKGQLLVGFSYIGSGGRQGYINAMHDTDPPTWAYSMPCPAHPGAHCYDEEGRLLPYTDADVREAMMRHPAGKGLF